MGYKYVKFSRGTARRNPQMIIDAYNKKINSLEDELRSFKEKKFVVRLWSYEHSIRGLITKNEILLNSGYPFKEELELNTEDIIKYYNQLQEQNKKELELLEEIEDIRAELFKFRNNYER